MSATTVVVTENTGIIGRAVKANADVARIVVDLSQWLDSGETIAAVGGANVAVGQAPAETVWQTDYPLAPFNVPATDTDPLVLVNLSISGTSVNVLLDDGTPGLSYVVSFLVTGSTSGRTKEIDIVVAVIAAVNPGMITSQSGPSTDITTTTSLALTLGYSGTVYVQNTTGAPVTITLPPTPSLGQQVTGMDVGGNASTNAIHWVGAGGALIIGQPGYDFTTNYQSATFRWNGSGWGIV